MDREVLGTIEREIDQELRGRLPGSAVRQAVLLQYGDDPEIEPGDLRVRVLLDADGPQDNWEPALTAFEQADNTAIELLAGIWRRSSGRSGWSSTRSATTRHL